MSETPMTTSTVDSDVLSNHDPKQYRRVLVSSFLGSTVEFYDFLLYGTAASLVFGELFFSDLSDSASLAASFATFAAGYVARPLGGVIFGHVGDRLGRKRTLVMTMLIMGIASTCIGLLPTYAQIGVTAPMLLLLVRLLQGIAVGGEWGGAALIALEHAPQQQRGLAASMANMGGPAGSMLAGLAFAAVTLLPDDQLMSWGWRVPFLFSGVLVAVALWVRLRVSESPLFIEAQRLAEKKEKRQAPLTVVFTRYRKQLVLAVLGSLAAVMYSIFLASFGISVAKDGGLSSTNVLLVKSAAALVHVFAIAYFAKLSDRVGRRPVLLLGCALSAVGMVPLMALLHSGNTWLVLAGFLLGMPLIQGCLYGPTAAFITERFSTDARYTGSGISYQLASTIAGFGPLVATSLWAAGQNAFGDGVGQFGYVFVMLLIGTAISGVVAAFARETRDARLS